MYRQPMTSSVPGRSTVNVKPVRSAKSRAWRCRSRRLASSDMASSGGHPPPAGGALAEHLLPAPHRGGRAVDHEDRWVVPPVPRYLRLEVPTPVPLLGTDG